MSMTSLLSLGANAMFAAQTQLQTTGHNIANASTPGYSRQEASLSTVQGRYTGAGYVGRGVTVQTIERAVDSFKTNEVAMTASVAAADKTRMTLLSQLEGAVGTGANGIGQSATDFFNALSDVAAAPNDPSARQVALAKADDLASMFRSTSAQIESLQSSVTQDVKSTVETVNSLSQRIAQLNEAIAGTNGGSHSANDLLDQRDQLIQELSGYVQVTRVEQDDGSMNLFIGGGQSLVLGRQANRLDAELDPFDATRVNVHINVAGESRLLSQNSLVGGSLAGLMQFQDEDLAAMRNGLGQLAAALTGKVNEQQESGFDLSGGAGSALFSTLQGNVIASRLNATPALASPQALMTVTNPSALKASEYVLKVESSGSYSLTRQSDGQSWNLSNATEKAAAQTENGFSVDLTPLATQAAGNRFLLQPVSQVASGMKMVLTDPADLAAANSVVLQGASANTGSATVKSVILDGSASPTGTVIQFGAATASGGRNYTVNGVASATPWTPGGTITANGMSVVFNGVPASGDTFTANATTQWAANNGNALSLADLMNGKLVDGATFTDAYSHMLADLGARAQSAETAYEVSSGVAARAKEQLGASTGVNLDEEAAKLLQYQQAYQAASKILQVAQKVFDTVLSLGQ